MKKDTEIRLWKGVTLTLIFCGAIIIALAYILLQLEQIDTSYMQWMSSIALALTSLGLASFAVFKTVYSEKRIADLEKKEIVRKLSNFSVTNNYNIKLIENLINHKKNWFPQDLLDKKLNQPPNQKYRLTPTERNQIKGLWIPKEDFIYEYAVHILDISHHLDDEFVEEIFNYITTGRRLNKQKENCQHWALSRGVPNPDETNNYYNALENANEIVNKMADSIIKQIQNFNNTN